MSKIIAKPTKKKLKKVLQNISIIIISIKVLLEYCRNLSGGEKIKRGNYANTRKENFRPKQRKKKRLREKLSLQKKKLLNYLINHVEKLENISHRDHP